MVRKLNLAVAIVLAGLVFGTLLLGTGAAEADAEPGVLDGTLAVAPSRPGDRAVYALNLIIANEGLARGLEAFTEDNSNDAPAIVIDGNARLELQRLSDRLLPVGGGLSPVSSFATSWASGDVAFGDWDEFYGNGASYYEDFDPFSDFDPDDAFDDAGALRGEPWHVAHVDASNAVVATTVVGSDADFPGFRLAQDLDVEPGLSVVTRPGPSGAPCGFHSDLQDGPRPLTQPIHVDGVCPPPGGSFGIAPAELKSNRFLAVGYDNVGGRQAIVFAQEDDADAMRLWFTRDVPYPVRMLVPLQLFEGMDFHMHLLYEMTDFVPGTLPAATFQPALPVAPTGQLGPAADGLVHPFPLADALLAARDDVQDTGTKEFLDAHPDAVVDEARFVHVRDGDQPRERWAFTLVSGGDALHVTATKGAPSNVGGIDPNGLGLPLTIPPLPPPFDDGIAVTSVQGSSAGRAAAAQRPLGLPTVAGLLAAWQADGGGAGTPAYGFHLRADGGSWMAAGQAELALDRSQGTEQTLGFSFLGVGPDGTFRFLEESPGRYDVPGQRAPGDVGAGYDPDSDDHYRDPRGFALASVGFWRLPESRTTATVSVAAVVAGLLGYALLPAKFGLGLFSRIGDDEVLEHPMRAQIADLVEAEPGIHFQELVRRLDAGRGTMEHHLRKLVAANVVSQQAGPGFTCYFPKGKVDRHLMAAAPVLKSDGARQVLQCIQEQPGRPAQDIAGLVGLTPSTVAYHLKRLHGSGLIVPTRDGRFVRLTPTPLGTQALSTWSGT